MAGGDPFPRPAGRSGLARAGRDSPPATAAAPRSAIEPVAPADWVKESLAACGRCAPAASSCTARMTAPASGPTTSASRSRRRSPSAPATTAPRAAACWRSTIWRSGGGATTGARPRHRFGRAGDRGGENIPHARHRERHRPGRGRGRARQCAAQSRRRGDHLRARRRRQGPRHRARRALRFDLRQYPARAAAAAGGAAQPARRACARASCSPACCRATPMPCSRSTARRASCSNAVFRSMAGSRWC